MQSSSNLLVALCVVLMYMYYTFPHYTVWLLLLIAMGSLVIDIPLYHGIEMLQYVIY